MNKKENEENIEITQTYQNNLLSDNNTNLLNEINTKTIQKKLEEETLTPREIPINDEILENDTLTLTLISGNLFLDKTIIINSLGLENIPLIRKQNDRIVNFGPLIYDKDKISINDYIINLPKNLNNIVQTLFSFSYDIELKKYFLSPNYIDNYIDTIIFLKVNKKFKIDKKIFVSLGEVHFSIEPIENNKLIIEITFENNSIKQFTFYNKNNNIITIGRGKKCNIVLSNLSYSRIQCSIVFENNFWFIIDGDREKESTNGTWVFINWDYDIEDNFIFRIGQNIIQVNLNKFKIIS